MLCSRGVRVEARSCSCGPLRAPQLAGRSRRLPRTRAARPGPSSFTPEGYGLQFSSGSNQHAQPPKQRPEGHRPPEAHHAGHHQPHNRAAEEEEASLQITLLLSLSVALLLLPWAATHPAFFIAPVLLACTPVVGSGVRPLLKEAGLGIVQALKVSVGLLPRSHPHDQLHGPSAHTSHHRGSHHRHTGHVPSSHPNQQQQEYGAAGPWVDAAASSSSGSGYGRSYPFPEQPASQQGGASSTPGSLGTGWYEQQGPYPVLQPVPSSSSSSSQVPQGPYSPWPRDSTAAGSSIVPSRTGSGSSSAVPHHQGSKGDSNGSPPGSPASSVDYHDFLEHHDRDPRRLSKEEKRERHSHGNGHQQPLL